jgi:hypothetical protein
VTKPITYTQAQVEMAAAEGQFHQVIRRPPGSILVINMENIITEAFKWLSAHRSKGYGRRAARAFLSRAQAAEKGVTK